MKNIDILIIGAGISGSTLARQYAEMGKKVVILEKRNHIAGNCFDYIDENGILVSQYGAHLFHTNDEEVWEFVNRFSKWYPWEHKVIARVDDETVPIPVNITTVNKLFGENISLKSFSLLSIISDIIIADTIELVMPHLLNPVATYIFGVSSEYLPI